MSFSIKINACTLSFKLRITRLVFKMVTISFRVHFLAKFFLERCLAFDICNSFDNRSAA